MFLVWFRRLLQVSGTGASSSHVYLRLRFPSCPPRFWHSNHARTMIISQNPSIVCSFCLFCFVCFLRLRLRRRDDVCSTSSSGPNSCATGPYASSMIFLYFAINLLFVNDDNQPTTITGLRVVSTQYRTRTAEITAVLGRIYALARRRPRSIDAQPERSPG